VELYKRHGCILQMGGSDQWGNIVNGIDLGRRLLNVQLFALTTPLLTTSSGSKMGKTETGAVWLNADMTSPYQYWQFWRNCEDADVVRLLKLFTELPREEIAHLAQLKGEELNEAKRVLATEATALLHGREAAELAASAAQRTFEEGTLAETLPTVVIPRPTLESGLSVQSAFVEAGLVDSNSEARRQIKGGGLRVNDVAVTDEKMVLTPHDLTPEGVIKVSLGRKRHVLLKPIDVFEGYKRLRNKVSQLARDDALRVIWAYCQYLQVDGFTIPSDIHAPKVFLHDQVPRRFIAEWELELLAKEILLNAGTATSKGRTLRHTETLRDIVNTLKAFENQIYPGNQPSSSVLIELSRIAHRQFIWQGNPPNAATTVRYFKIFNHPQIVDICLERLGLTVEEIYLSGMTLLGSFLSSPAINVMFRSEMKQLPVEKFERFLAFTSKPLGELKSLLKAEQKYDSDFAYAYSSLREFPIIRMLFNGDDAFVCPLPTLLFWRITGGLYYDLIEDPRFPNPFGESFQKFVGEVCKRAFTSTAVTVLPEEEYGPRNARKRSVDWIIADENAAMFLECKAKRLSWDAKASLTDLSQPEADLDSMAVAVIQVYKTISDYQAGLYSHFPYEAKRKIYPVIVTLENWRMFGHAMLDRLSERVRRRAKAEGLSEDLIETMPYTVLAIEELEVGNQIINSVGIAEFFDEKLNDPAMRTWEWHGYMTRRFPRHFPARRLFDAEYDQLFGVLDEQGTPTGQRWRS
jgi:tRNA synthetases class I (W and Y)/S4 domain